MRAVPCCVLRPQASRLVSAGAVAAVVPLLASHSRSCQEAALLALAALTQHSSTACQQVLTSRSPTLQHTLQQQPQPPSLPAPPASDAAVAGGGGKQAPAAAQSQQVDVAGVEQQQAATVAAAQQQPQQPLQQQGQHCQVLAQLLVLARQRDHQLRFLVARCISNLPAQHQLLLQDGAAWAGGGGSSNDALQEVRVVMGLHCRCHYQCGQTTMWRDGFALHCCPKRPCLFKMLCSDVWCFFTHAIYTAMYSWLSCGIWRVEVGCEGSLGPLLVGTHGGCCSVGCHHVIPQINTHGIYGGWGRQVTHVDNFIAERYM